MEFPPDKRHLMIRAATRDDSDAVRSLHLSAFPDGEGDAVSRLALELLAEDTSPPVLSFVHEAGGVIAGHVAFSPVKTAGTGGFIGYILAPLAVHPDHQRLGIGSRLVEHGIGRLSETGAGLVFVYGDPRFYGRFGFRVDAATGYRPPHPLQHPFGWQAMPLVERPMRRAVVNLSCVAPLDHPALW